MSKQDIEKRLGFAAQGVKAEMAIGSYKQGDRTVTVNGKKYEVLPYQMDFFIKELATLDTPEWRADVVKEYLRRGYIKSTSSRPSAKAAFASPKYRAFVYRGSPSNNVLVKATEFMDSASAAEDAAKQIVMSFRGKPGYSSNNYFADIAQETPEGAKTVKNNIRFSRPGVKAEFVATPADLEKWLKRVKRQASWTKGIVQSDARSGEVDSDTISELKNFLLLSRGIENKNKSEAKKAIQALKGLVGESMLSQLIHDGLIEWANSTTASRPGAKAEMGFLSRVGYAATALTADPADPKSPEYRKQVAEAKAAAKDAITNYKFMRDKVKERLAALDAYVTNAIKVINTATSAKDIEHYVEQLRIAVKSQSMILGASKSPFARNGVKADFAAMGPAPLRGSPARKAEIAEEKAAAVARAAARAAAIDEEKATIQRKLNTLRPRYRELADYLKAATPRIYKLNTETYTTSDMKKKAKLEKLIDKELAVKREAEIAVKQTSREISELEKRARKLGMTLQASRPGVKATFGLRVPELETLYSSLGASGQAITDKPSARKDRALLLKLDAEYSQPTDTVMVALNAAKLYRQLSAGSKATPQGQKFQQRLEIAGGHRFTRPGSKAKA